MRALVVLGAVAASALGQPLFAALDADQDGRLSFAELEQQLDALALAGPPGEAHALLEGGKPWSIGKGLRSIRNRMASGFKKKPVAVAQAEPVAAETPKTKPVAVAQPAQPLEQQAPLEACEASGGVFVKVGLNTEAKAKMSHMATQLAKGLVHRIQVKCGVDPVHILHDIPRPYLKLSRLDTGELVLDAAWMKDVNRRGIKTELGNSIGDEDSKRGMLFGGEEVIEVDGQPLTSPTFTGNVTIYDGIKIKVEYSYKANYGLKKLCEQAQGIMKKGLMETSLSWRPPASVQLPSGTCREQNTCATGELDAGATGRFGPTKDFYMLYMGEVYVEPQSAGCESTADSARTCCVPSTWEEAVREAATLPDDWLAKKLEEQAAKVQNEQVYSTLRDSVNKLFLDRPLSGW